MLSVTDVGQVIEPKDKQEDNVGIYLKIREHQESKSKNKRESALV
uniref:Uncharacterized protein n=1 Tax=Rhizophora mucronata TaxID=61149 RepID=A0A2P2PU37_RHIMU